MTHKESMKLKDVIIEKLNEIYKTQDFHEIYNSVDDILFESDYADAHIGFDGEGVYFSADFNEEGFDLKTLELVIKYFRHNQDVYNDWLDSEGLKQ